MKRLLRYLLIVFLILPIFFGIAPKSNAYVDCGNTTPPEIIEADQRSEIPFTLHTTRTTPENVYKVHFAGGVLEGGFFGTGQHDYTNITAAADGSLSWIKQAGQRYDTADQNARFIVYDSSNRPLCEEKFNVRYIDCQINIEQTAPKNGEEITINIDGLLDRGGDYNLQLWRGENLETRIFWRRVSDSRLVNNQSYPLGELEGGKHSVILYDRTAPVGDAQAIDAIEICRRGFNVTLEGGTVDDPPSNEGPTADSAFSQPLSLPCQGEESCAEIQTAIGGIKTGQEGFIEDLLAIILSLAGGIALLLIIASGYKLMTSQGDPEKVKEAKERLTAAIVGLLFIIFSLVILEAITVDILQIPGFSK